MSNRTPFYDRHLKLGGKIIDFFGWELPVQYSSISQEHLAVRNQSGMFDISHMGQVLVWGEESLDFLNFLLTNDISKIQAGQAIYAHMLNEKGTVIDDLFVYRLTDDRFLVIINASRRDVDMKWMEKQSRSFSVSLMEAPYAAAFALQGPQAVALGGRLNPDILSLNRNQIGEFTIGDSTLHVARTGYTGEDGLEFFGPAGHLLPLWDQIFERGAEFGLLPCGLGARDTLRTEVGYPLYGHELDEQHTPLEANLEWVIKWNKGDFIGREALERQKTKGLSQKLYGFRVDEGGVARAGATIWYNGANVGTVASGTFGPSLGYAIGTAFLPAEIPLESASLIIRQGSREFKAQTTKMPFYKKPVAVIPE
jgi:aminomethyltransferase